MLEIGFVFTGIKGFTPSGMPFIKKKRLTGTSSGKIGANLANVPIFMKLFRLLWVDRCRYLIVIFSAGDGIKSLPEIHTAGILTFIEAYKR